MPNPGDPKAANYAHLVKPLGKLIYTVKLETGYKDVPAGNQLAITTNIGVQPAGPCTLSDPAGPVPLGQGLNALVPKGQMLTCTIEVAVNDLAHKQGGKVPAFTVQAIYSGPNTTTNQFYVAPQLTSDVPVYTGSYLDTPTSEVQGAFFNSE